MALLAQLNTDVATVATAGTAVVFGAGIARKLRVKAPAANAGLIYIGGASADAATGYELSPGDEYVFDYASESKVGSVPEFDLANHYVDAANNGDKMDLSFLVY